MPLDTNDDFQNELTELFVQEAHEWLQQIHVALDELQQSPAPERHVKLVEIIKGGITNLGGSAATINLHDVEQATFSAVPFIEAVQDPSTSISVNDFLALCKHLGHIHTALTNATGVSFDAEAGASAAQSQSTTVATSDLLAALQRLRQDHASNRPSDRNLIQAVIAQVEGLIKNGVTHCEVASFKESLDRVAREEDAFLHAVREHVPIVTGAIQELKAGRQSTPSLCGGDALLEQVTQLGLAAQQVNAAPALTFFKGLQTFIDVVSKRRVEIGIQRFEAVEARLSAVTDTLHAWVEAGRQERAAIGSVLLASLG